MDTSHIAPQASGGNTANPAFHRKNGSQGDGEPGHRAVTESAIDATAYPILTEEVSFPTPAPRSYGPGAAGTGSIGQTVESALRDVLGLAPQDDGPERLYRRADAVIQP